MNATMVERPANGIGISAYRAIAHRYDHLHDRFLRIAGAGGQSAFEGAVLALMDPGMKILDAACGTGAFASRLVKLTGNRIDLTLLDGCSEMLNQTGLLPAKRILGRLEHLPFANDSFDLVSCAWGIETTRQPAATVMELTRVVRPGGYMCFVTCADMPSLGMGGWLMKYAIMLRQTGQFINPAIVAEIATDPCIAFARIIPCRGPVLAVVIKKT